MIMILPHPVSGTRQGVVRPEHEAIPKPIFVVFGGPGHLKFLAWNVKTKLMRRVKEVWLSETCDAAPYLRRVSHSRIVDSASQHHARPYKLVGTLTPKTSDAVFPFPAKDAVPWNE